MEVAADDEPDEAVVVEVGRVAEGVLGRCPENRWSPGRGAAGTRGRPDKQVAQVRRILLKPRLHFQHHVILVQLRKHGGHFPLAVSVV